MSNLNSTFLSRKLNTIFVENNDTCSMYFYSKTSSNRSKEEKNKNNLLSISSNFYSNQIIKKQNSNKKRCLVFELLHRIKAPIDIRNMYIFNKPGNFDPRIDRIKPLIYNAPCISPYAFQKIKDFLDINSINEATNFNANLRAYEEYYKSRGKIETELYHKFSEITYGMEYADFFEIFPILRGMNKDPDLYLFMVSYHLHHPKNVIDLDKPTIDDAWKLIHEYQAIKNTYKMVE